MLAIRSWLWFSFLLAVSLSVACAERVTTWEPGMYWTYDATTTYMDAWGRTETGKVTLIVLGKDFVPDSGAWLVAGVRDWWSGGEVVTPVWVFEPVQGYVRWPSPASLLAKVQPESLYSSLALLAARTLLAPYNAPVRIETVGQSMNSFVWRESPERPDWLDTDQELGPGETAESITLIPGNAEELVLSSGRFLDAVPVRYQWMKSGDRDSGVAWWIPELLFWGCVEGREEVYDSLADHSYKVTLAEWGRLSEDEMKDRLRSGLDRMELFDLAEAEALRTYLADFGLGL